MPAANAAGPAFCPPSTTFDSAFRPAEISLVMAFVIDQRANYTLAVRKRRFTAALPAAYVSSGRSPVATPRVIIATCAAV